MPGVSGLAALISSFAWPGSEQAPPWLRRLGLIAFSPWSPKVCWAGCAWFFSKTNWDIPCNVGTAVFRARLCDRIVHQSLVGVVWGPWAGEAKTPQFQGQGPSKSLAWFCLRAGVNSCSNGSGATMRHQHAGLAIPDARLRRIGRLWMSIHRSLQPTTNGSA